MRGGESTETVIRMNAPVSFGGWIFYQSSYANGGRTSVITAVRNPVRFFSVDIGARRICGYVADFSPNPACPKKHAV